jgi:hypothetical protein
MARVTTPELWTNQKNPESNFFREKQNLTVRGSLITIIHRPANCTMATKVQTSFSPEV